MTVPTPYIHLPLHIGTRDETDSSNVHTKDVIRRKDAVLGDGSTVSEFPVQKYDKGLQFDGSNQFAQVSDPITDASESAFTISFLAKMDSSSSSYIYSVHNGTSLHSAIYFDTSTNTWTFYCGTFSALNSATFVDNDADLLRHVVGIWDGIDTKIYVDAVAGTDATTPTAPKHADQNLFICTSHTETDHYTGQMFDFKIWNDVALTEYEVQELYAADVAEYQAYLSFPEPTDYLDFLPSSYVPSLEDTVENVPDWDMSDPTTDEWTKSGSGLTLSKEDNGEGGLCLRLTNTNSTNPYAWSTTLSMLNANYQVSKFRYRTDGIKSAFVLTRHNEENYLSPTTEWKEFEFEELNTSSTLRLGIVSAAAGGWVEFDYASRKYQIRTFKNLGTRGGYLTNGWGNIGEIYTRNAVARPGIGIAFDTDYMRMSIQPDISGASPFAASFLTEEPDDNNTGYISYLTGAGGAWYYFTRGVASGIATYDFYCGGWGGGQLCRYSMPKTQEANHWVISWDGTNQHLYLNGTLVATASAPTGPESITGGLIAFQSGTYPWLDAPHYAFRFWEGIGLTAEEARAVYEEDNRIYAINKV